MQIEQVLKELELRFTSSNDVPVTRAVIKREEWEVVKLALQQLLSTPKS